MSMRNRTASQISTNQPTFGCCQYHNNQKCVIFEIQMFHHCRKDEIIGDCIHFRTYMRKFLFLGCN